MRYMKSRIRILSLLILVFYVFSLLPTAMTVTAEENELTVNIISEEISDTTMKINGTVSGVTENASLVLNVAKNGDYYSSKTFITEADGSFETEIEVDNVPDEKDDVYDYTISEVEPVETVSVIKSDDFATDSSYTVKAERDKTEGNPAPSMSVLSSDSRILYTGSSTVVTNDNSIYSVSADVRVDEVKSINKQIFAVSNSSGNGNGTNTEINKLGHSGFNAFKISAVNGSFYAEYADNPSEQTEIVKTQIGTYATGSWTNIKAEFSPESLELKLFINGVQVLENEELYILAQQNYRRLFDTWNSSGSMFIDNLHITKTSFSKLLGIEPASSSIVNYSQKTKNEIVDAINSADADTVISVLNTTKNTLVIGIDTSNLQNLTDDENLSVAEYIKSKHYNNISEIKSAYEYISVYLDVITASEDELGEKLVENSDELGISKDNLYYEDADIISAIYRHMDNVSSPDELINMLVAYGVIYELKNVDKKVLYDNYEYLKNYGITENYDALSADGIESIVASMRDYSFNYEDSYDKILSEWTREINRLYDEMIIASFDYIVSNESFDVVDSNVYLKGKVTPPIEYKFRASAMVDDNEIAYTEFMTNADGSYECTMELPVSEDDLECNIVISAVEPEPDNKYYFYDTFTSGERIGNYIVNKELYQTPYNGQPAPSMCVAKEEGEERPRLLAGSGVIRDMVNSDTLCIEADIMKAQNIASPKLWSITDYNGNKEAMTVKATSTDIVLYYKDADEGFITSTLIKDYQKIKWYNIKFEVVMSEGEKEVNVFVDGTNTLNFILSADIPNIGRFFDSEAMTVDSDIHYIDNIKCYIDQALRIKASKDYVSVIVPGSVKITEAIEMLMNSNTDEYVNVIDNYNDVFGIDTTIVKNLKDSSSVDKNMTTAHFKNVAGVRKIYYSECHLQQIKEADNYEKIALVEAYSDDFDISGDFGNKEYGKFLINNISYVENSDAVKEFHDKISAGAALKEVTQMTARDTIDKYTVLLEKYGMSKSYSKLNSSKRKSVSLELVKNMPETYDIETFLEKVSDIIDEAAKKQKDSDDSSGVGGTSSKPSVGSISAPVQINTFEKETTFTDVPSSHWGYDAIEFLSDKNIINGMGNGCFMPDANVKREEFVKMILSALNQKLYEYENVYTDVDSAAWYAPYVVTASKLAISNGKSESVFGIGESITRQDAAVMLYRCLDKLSSDCHQVREAKLFEDDNDIADYAKEAVYQLYECNVINGVSDNVFSPAESLTRAQAAKLIYEIIG